MHAAGLTCWNIEREDYFCSSSRQLELKRGEMNDVHHYKEQRMCLSVSGSTYIVLNATAV